MNPVMYPTFLHWERQVGKNFREVHTAFTEGACLYFPHPPQERAFSRKANAIWQLLKKYRAALFAFGRGAKNRG